MAWMIVGDTERHKGCLVTICYGGKEFAERTLERMKNNPTKEDLFLTKGHTNLRIKEGGDS